ncbi:hypothetical protein I7I53_06042 [Histoplasma capsulatum var. duboisii H88]|uniref:Uncharacterized protein n=1 Tax=Ajellomyces capsulatus (strain H88) TaxID=544711 RepID=A0A8A1LB19_AJEC8|nr:hypothetical protein I7I53_06042 [Histoplasma capsulatum var. duboisii H88]
MCVYTQLIIKKMKKLQMSTARCRQKINSNCQNINQQTVHIPISSPPSTPSSLTSSGPKTRIPISYYNNYASGTDISSSSYATTPNLNLPLTNLHQK